MEMTLYFWSPFISNSLIMKKTHQIPVMRHLTKYLISTLKTVKVIKNKECLESWQSQEKMKETWQLNVMWYPGWNPNTEKDIKQKLRKFKLTVDFS